MRSFKIKDSSCKLPLWFAFLRSMCMHAKLLQSCPTLCNPLDCSSPGSSVHEILQARILEYSCLPCPPPGDLPDPGIKPVSSVVPALEADSLSLSHQGNPSRNIYLIISKDMSSHLLKIRHLMPRVPFPSPREAMGTSISVYTSNFIQQHMIGCTSSKY